jgi:ribosome biogenesis GTPase
MPRRVLLNAQLERLGWSEELDSEFRPYADEGLAAGRVAVQHRGMYGLYTADGDLQAEIAGRLLHEGVVADLPAVGDWVAYRPLPGEDRGIIQAVLPRSTRFSRKTTLGATEEQVVAANVDVVFLVMALTEQDLKPRRLERYLTMAWESGANPVIVLTKKDLCPDLPAALAEVSAVAFGVPVEVVSNVTGEGIESLRAYADGNRTVALLGSSGVGKSTLVNSLLGEERLATKEIRESDGRGRHTTTHRELVPLPEGGLVLDTPGMRELQLWSADEGIGASFGDVEELAAQCRFHDCAHDSEPGCAVRAAIADGTLPAERFESYEKLQRELAMLARRQDKRAQAEARKERARFARSQRKSVW